MKNKLLFSTLLFVACTLSINVNAQLEVETSGDVKVIKNLSIGTDPNNKRCLYVRDTILDSSSAGYYGVYSYLRTGSTSYAPIYGIYGISETYAYAPGTVSNYPIIGVYGYAGKNFGSTQFNAGIAGVAHYAGGIGIYGTVNQSFPSSLPSYTKYAGYFDGQVNINGILNATTIVLNGDTLHVNNIRDLTRERANNIKALRPISYTFKADSAWIENEESKSYMQGIHYGLNAYEVQKIYPELVYTQGDYLSVNYIEMIPLLIQEIQILSEEVYTLKAQIKDLQTK